MARALRKQVAARARREHYPAPYAIIELWERHGARGAQAYEAEARSIAELMCTETSRNLVRVFLLQDRLKGRGEFVTPWPRDTKFPNLEQRKGIQEALIKLGLYEGLVDGRIGPLSQAAYAKFQASKGEVADGFITLDSYEELHAAAAAMN